MATDLSGQDPVGALAPTSQITGGTSDNSRAFAPPGAPSQGADPESGPFVRAVAESEEDWDFTGDVSPGSAGRLPAGPPRWTRAGES
jgi:hypothetical protein